MPMLIFLLNQKQVDRQNCSFEESTTSSWELSNGVITNNTNIMYA